MVGADPEHLVEVRDGFLQLAARAAVHAAAEVPAVETRLDPYRFVPVGERLLALADPAPEDSPVDEGGRVVGVEGQGRVAVRDRLAYAARLEEERGAVHVGLQHLRVLLDRGPELP